MKKKLLLGVLSLATAACMAFGLVGCGENKDTGKNDDLWTIERVYAMAQEKGFEGTLDELLEMLKGEKGDKGDKGDDGKDGQNGKDGENGLDGVGIKSVRIDERGHLMITLTNDNVIDAGEVNAESEAEEKIYTEGLAYQETRTENGEKAYAVVGIGTAYDIDIVIPSTFNGCPVVSIAEYAFCAELIQPQMGVGLPGRSYYKNIKSIVIPDSVTTIGNSAFSYCSGLTSVTIGDSVTTIGYRAFYNCGGLTSVTIGDSVTTIGGGAFYNCSSLTSITIPDSVTSIGYDAFSGCSSLTSVTIPDSVTEIGDSAFLGCSSLTDITYKGTKENWAIIKKGSRWDYDDLFASHSRSYTVHCTDGTLKKGEF